MIVLGSAFEGIEGDEARDEKAQEIAQMIFDGAYGNSGQRCTAARMLIMDGSPEALLVYEKFIALVEQEHKIGNAFDGENLYGALNDAGAAFKMDALTAAANSLKDQGYVVKTHGGGRISENEAPKGGIYYRPAVLDWREVPIDVMKSTKIVIGHKWDKEAGAEVPVETSLYEALRHETFGPMVNIVAQAKDREHAVELVKEWDAEGLAAGGVGNKADLEYLHKELEEGKVVTTFNSNGTPKDHSPNRAHGNVSQPFHTGGEHWDESYTREFETTDRAEIEQAQIVHRNSGLALAS